MPIFADLALFVEAGLWAIVLPASVSAGLLALILRLGKGRLVLPTVALALTVGLLVGNAARGAIPLVPESRAWHWLIWMTVVITALSLVARLPWLPLYVAWTVRLTSAMLAAYLLVSWDLWVKGWPLGLFLALVMLEWGFLEMQATRWLDGGTPLGLGLVFGVAALILLHAHSAVLADVALLMAASLAGIGVVAWRWRIDTGPVAAGSAILLPSLLMIGYTSTFSDVPWSSFALVVLAPLAPALTYLRPLSRLNGWQLRMLQLAILLLPLLVALAQAMVAESLAAA